MPTPNTTRTKEDGRRCIDTDVNKNRYFINNDATDQPKPRYAKNTQVDNTAATSFTDDIQVAHDQVVIQAVGVLGVVWAGTGLLESPAQK